MGSFVLALLTALSGPAAAGDLDLGYTPSPQPGEDPAFMVTPSRGVKELVVVIDSGGDRHEFSASGVGGGQTQRFSWDRDDRVTSAEAYVRAVFNDGFVEELSVPISWSYSAPLSVELDDARADVKERTLTVKVTAPVMRAEVKAFGAHKALLDERDVPIGEGPGEITIPWVGAPEDVVLLDVTLHGENAWTGFTYSPWFLDIPHDDVLFDSDSDVIAASEEPKLQKTLRDLEEVIDKYGAIVPVQLYIAGCTDTVGDAASNMDLSKRRARAIARWLRAHGFDRPIFFHGFGESLLAVGTPDGTDEPRNRRALYMVGANPPPAGSGVPSVRWQAL
ncbi:MAG: OmpA family protein [Alphaproteobacteria bacterium]|nr:OmpA family protein [Alphaproteobacteria bacterium]